MKSWLSKLGQQLGIGDVLEIREGVGADLYWGLSALRGQGLGGNHFSSHCRGYLVDRAFLDSLDRYGHAHCLIIACVEYSWLEPGRNGGHAVLIVGATPDEIIYHDPGLHSGANRRVSRKTFFRAWNLYNFSSLGGAVTNGLAVWDPDRHPTRDMALGKGKPEAALLKTDAQDPPSPEIERNFRDTVKKYHSLKKCRSERDGKRSDKAVFVKRITRILCLVNFSRGTLNGLRSAVELARTQSGRIDILCTLPIWDEKKIPARSRVMRGYRAINEILAAQKAEWHFETRTLTECLETHLQLLKPDLVVLGEQDVIEATSLCQSHEVPFWIEKSPDLLAKKSWKNILVPLDGRKRSLRPLREAIALAEKHRGSVLMLHVRQAGAPHLEKAVRALVRNVAWGDVQNELLVCDGAVEKTIINVAKKKKCPLVIMGTLSQGHPDDPEPLISYTAEVIETCPTSLLVVHPHGK